jgi:hypothetical protein
VAGVVCDLFRRIPMLYPLAGDLNAVKKLSHWVSEAVRYTARKPSPFTVTPAIVDSGVFKPSPAVPLRVRAHCWKQASETIWPESGELWRGHCPGGTMVALAKARRVLGACMLVALVASAYADTLYLKNGMLHRRSPGDRKKMGRSITGWEARSTQSRRPWSQGSSRATAPRWVSTPPIAPLPAVQDLSHRDPDPTTANARHDKLQMPVPGGPSKSELIGWLARPDPPG